MMRIILMCHCDSSGKRPSFINRGWNLNRSPFCYKRLIYHLFVPQTELFLGNIVGKMVALAATPDAAFVAAAFACAIPTAAVLQHTWVPLQSQAIRAETWLPQVFSRMTSLKAGCLCCLRQDLKYWAVYPCNKKKQVVSTWVKQKHAIRKCEAIPLCFPSDYCIELERANKVGKKRGQMVG